MLSTHRWDCTASNASNIGRYALLKLSSPASLFDQRHCNLTMQAPLEGSAAAEGHTAEKIVSGQNAHV